jgi:Spy/CpxP family protein refolding chaperone
MTSSIGNIAFRALCASVLLVGFAAPAAAQAPAKAPAPAPAQAPERGSPEAVDAVRQAVRTDKRGLVAKNMELTDAEAKKFWPLYDGYQADLDRIRKRQNRAVLDYVNAQSSMTDGNAKRIAREILDAEAEEQKLRERQLKEVSKALPATKAVRYLQIENKIRILNQYDTASQISLLK